MRKLTPESHASAVPSPQPDPPSSAPQAPALPLKARPRTRNGKVARLPHHTRRFVNEQLRDGVPYADIIQELGQEGEDLNEDNLSSWKAGGYQDWLHEQECLTLMRAKQDFALDLISQNQLSKIHEATLQIAVTHICELLRDFHPATLKDAFAGDPVNFTRLLNVLSKLTQGGLKCERDRLEAARCKTRTESIVEVLRTSGSRKRKRASRA